jgi:imidazolonepropionase-like amidohydrolase
MKDKHAIEIPEKARQVQWILAGWLIDGSGDAPQKDMLLEIHAETIHCIRKAGSFETLPEALTDFSGHTVLPALVDGHVHLCFSGSTDPAVRASQTDANYPAAKTIIEGHLSSHLACGIAAVRDGGDRHGHVARYRHQLPIALNHQVHIGSAGKAWHAPGRYGRLIGGPAASDIGLAASILNQAGANDHIKLVNSGLNSLKCFGRQTAPQFDLEILKQAVAAARQLGRKVMVHANGRLPVEMAVEAGCDSIEHGFFMGRENLARMAEKQVTWVPTAVTMQAYADHLPKGSLEADVARKNLDHQLEQLRWAKSLGVKVAAGTDAGSLGVNHGLALVEEIKLLLNAGYHLAEALCCASSRGAELLALKNRGRLAPGLRADFIVMKEDPERLGRSWPPPEQVYLAGRRLDPA